ncbi:MAG TPA: PCYCGC motif-containing (lipo)protein, partial [Vicinamibacterales bacterium]|nr:PCYCGC motif-containing (lipo)protein [Vicinamibacterales bacterium]
MLTAALSAGCSSQTDPPSGVPVDYRAQPAAPPVDPSADLRFLADDLPLLPPGVDRAERPVDVVRATYEFAARHPEVLEYVPCFCGCERGG